MEMVRSAAIRVKTIAEMDSRIKTMATVNEFDLCPVEDSWTKAIHKIKKVLDVVDDQSSGIERSWKRVDPNLSLWDIFLLEYACRTGEMQNHEPMATHVDGNTSHFLESYFAIGKCAQETKKAARKWLKKWCQQHWS